MSSRPTELNRTNKFVGGAVFMDFEGVTKSGESISGQIPGCHFSQGLKFFEVYDRDPSRLEFQIKKLTNFGQSFETLNLKLADKRNDSVKLVNSLSRSI